MLAFPVSVLAKPRGFACAVAIAFVAGTAVGWSAALPSAPGTQIGDAVTAARPLTWPVKPDFDLVFASLNVALPKQDLVKPVLVEAVLVKPVLAKQDSAKIAAVNFDDVFASFARESRESTPSRREKLRNAGWRRLQSATPKPTAERAAADAGVAVN